MVFMNHGLMLGIWMTAASMAGIWLWSTGTLKQLWGLRIGWYVVAQVVTTILCKSTGSLGLLVAGIGALYVTRFLRVSLILSALLALPVLYVGFRTVGNWDGTNLVDLIEVALGSERSTSLAFRMQNEDILVQRAIFHPWFGWGPGDAFLLSNGDGKFLAIPDGMWLLALCYSGIIELVSYLGTFLLPALVMFFRIPGRVWHYPAGAGAIILSVLLALLAIDNVVNAMINPIYMLVQGAVAGAAISAISRPRPRITRGKIPRLFRRKMNLDVLHET